LADPFGLSVSEYLTMSPFPDPARQTGRADFPHLGFRTEIYNSCLPTAARRAAHAFAHEASGVKGPAVAGSTSTQARMKTERRASLETGNLTAEPVRNFRLEQQLPGGLSSSHWKSALFSRRSQNMGYQDLDFAKSFQEAERSWGVLVFDPGKNKITFVVLLQIEAF
jgi:hypothetical protein